MHKHLQALVLTHIIYHILIYSARILWSQMIKTEYHGLLVLLNQLSLTRVCLTRYTRRQYVVDRRTIRVLFDIHRFYHHRTAGCIWISNVILVVCCILIQTFGIVSPFATYQVQCCQTQVSLLREISHVDTCKTN